MASPYLKDGRLADVIAAIQSMAAFERSSNTPSGWADLISGDMTRGIFWKGVLEDHPEFFRKAPTEDRYALVCRRSLTRRFDRRLRRLLSDKELKNISADQWQYISRPPISDSQTKMLIDVAISLHSKAREQSHDFRWFADKIFMVLAAAMGGLIGNLLSRFLQLGS